MKPFLKFFCVFLILCMFLNIGSVCARISHIDNFDDGVRTDTFWDSVYTVFANYNDTHGNIEMEFTGIGTLGGVYLISKPITRHGFDAFEFDATKGECYANAGAFGIVIRKPGDSARGEYGMPTDNSIVIACMPNPSQLIIYEWLNSTTCRTTYDSSLACRFNINTWYNIKVVLRNSTCIEVYKNNTLCHTQILDSSYSSWLVDADEIVIELHGRDYTSGSTRYCWIDNFVYGFGYNVTKVETEITVTNKNTKIFNEISIQVENIIRIIDKIKTAILAGVEAYGTIIKSITAILTYDTPPDIMSLIRLTLQIFTYEKGLQQIISAFTIIKSSMGILLDLIVNINTYYDGTPPYKTPTTILGNIFVVIVMLIVPPLLVSNYFGKIATIPMFYFMSVICYLTSLIPLSIFILITIGIVALFFIKRRSEQNA